MLYLKTNTTIYINILIFIIINQTDNIVSQYKNISNHTIKMASNIDRTKTIQSRRSNIPISNSRAQSHNNNNNSNDQSQYQIVVQFELRRQRQKTRILEERLHNKQMFIQQMKQYQDQLTFAFQKCQEQLIVAKKLLDQFHITQKDYLQEIAELKHLVIRLEDEINIRDKNVNSRQYNSGSDKKQKAESSPFQARQVRSKTMMNNQQDSPKGIVDPLQQELIKQSKKIAKFIKQFLMMSRCFCSQSGNEPLKNRLKVSWKWIKQVVKQWNDLKNQKQIWTNFLLKLQQKTRKSIEEDGLQKTLNHALMMIRSR